MAASNKNQAESAPAAPYAAYMRQVIEDGLLHKKPPIVTTDPNQLEEQAEKTMPKRGFQYIKGAAGESAAARSNRLAFQRWSIIPRVLVPTGLRDLSVTLFGKKYGRSHGAILSLSLSPFFSFPLSLPHQGNTDARTPRAPRPRADSPVLMAPIGVQALYHEDREIGTANACGALRVPYTLSTAASTSIEELTRSAAPGPRWYQLYWPTDDDITASILSRARGHGFETLVVTLDTWNLAWRPTDLDNANVPFFAGTGNNNGFEDPVFRAKFAERTGGATPEDKVVEASLYWIGQVCPGASRSWEDLDVLRRHWEGPIVLKGVLSVDDARLAVQHGMDGVIVSNHGGRQIDGCVATLDVLPEIVDAVGDQITVMLDSGIRTGADIVKALSLGAKAVFVGRPVMHGLGIAGQEGAKAVLAGLLADLDLTMGLSGLKSIASLQRSGLRHTPYLAQ